jgi:hypothetical protein
VLSLSQVDCPQVPSRITQHTGVRRVTTFGVGLHELPNGATRQREGKGTNENFAVKSLLYKIK